MGVQNSHIHFKSCICHFVKGSQVVVTHAIVLDTFVTIIYEVFCVIYEMLVFAVEDKNSAGFHMTISIYAHRERQLVYQYQGHHCLHHKCYKWLHIALFSNK